MVSRVLLLLSSLSTLASVVVNAQDATLNVYVDQAKGNGVTYGGDVKLSMWRSVEIGTIDKVTNRMAQGLKMDLIRLPMVARWPKWYDKNNDIRDFAKSAKFEGMDVMLSVANTNGTFNSWNNDLYGAHWYHKWDASLRCPEDDRGAGSACEGMNYGRVDPEKYSDWISSLLDQIDRDYVDYIGPYNEDGGWGGHEPFAYSLVQQ